MLLQLQAAQARLEAVEKQLAELKLKEGPAGTAATVKVGTVATGEPNTPATVRNSGSESAAVLDFVIPRGSEGTNGNDGKTPTEAELLALVRRIVDEKKEELKGADGQMPVVDYDKIVALVLAKIPKPDPLPSDKETHVVIVADQKADYWPRLSGEINYAKGYFSAIRIADPPTFSVPLPQLIVYADGKPTYRSSGLQSVANDLQRMVRGDFQPVLKPAL